MASSNLAGRRLTLEPDSNTCFSAKCSTQSMTYIWAGKNKQLQYVVHTDIFQPALQCFMP